MNICSLLRTTLLITTLLFGVSTASAVDIPGTVPSDFDWDAFSPDGATSIDPVVTEVGRISLSIDGVSSGNPTAVLQAEKPVGATVRKAIFATATTGWSNYSLLPGDVTINGVPVVWDNIIPNHVSSFNHIADVTDLVKPILDAAMAGRVPFAIGEADPDIVDGNILAVIFDDPNQTDDATAILLFGAQDVAGDQFLIGLAEPLDLADPSSVVTMSLGISYGYQMPDHDVQFSLVDVNGSRLSSSAGGQDDGISPDWNDYGNGALITVGGLDDDPANPPDPFSPPLDFDYDDELYDLIPFVQQGDVQITVNTSNPSNDDNIFFGAFYLTVPAIIGEGCLLSPTFATNPVGTQHTVTATVNDEDANPVADREVNFEIIGGPHSGLVDAVMTDGNGKADFVYTGNSVGIDTIQAWFMNSADEMQMAENFSYKEWTDEGIHPTNEWINVYCRCPKLNGVLLSEGDVIKAYDPDGVLCGQDVVRADGSFGFMPIYRDDFVTLNLDEGAEPGDQISFTINDVEVFTDPVIYWTSNGDSFELCRFHTCKIIHLHEGWNLISWNLNYTELTSDFVLSHLDKCECVDVILGFDRGAMTYDPFLPQYSTLPYVDYFHGYWLKMHCAWDLEICGETIDPSEYIDIYTGWNLVSYWPVQTLPLEVGFATILDCIEIAIGFDNGGQVWVPGKEPFNTLTDLSELFGYWIKSSCDGALIYPGWDTPPPAPDGLAKPLANSDRDVTPSRTWMSLYGSDIKVDGSIIDNNSVIEAYSADQVLCGRGVYMDGMLRFTPVYGQDNLDDATAGYPTGEEPFSICVNKVRVYPDITWTGNGNVFGLTQLSTKATAAGLQPIDYSLAQNYPNPFNPTTVISYNLPSASHVRLSVYNLLGQNVRTLVDGESTAGTHREIWDATDDGGNPVASGVYFYRLETTDFTQTKKMLLAK
ncbi:MAG: T9SS type A sorting domain-containing protein [candidate division Zixibacteria bacterium]|nr:T9SS type A sorting domain-containing protein [candidate division Zixibacteria bacterium]MBU1469181.1 T9SS type A sorting domain-containing protein [candidate division Zixibacteria bacterium]MBU2626581.1 T9SS type A sorting domain-containing protein [candidate division Zixibacteria bacterium]